MNQFTANCLVVLGTLNVVATSVLIVMLAKKAKDVDTEITRVKVTASNTLSNIKSALEDIEI